MSSVQPNSFPSDPNPEHHLVDTPEQVQLRFPLAGIGSRFLAIALDTLIQTGILIVLSIALSIGAFGVFALFREGTLWIAAGAVVVLFLLYYGYFAFFEILWNGQTPGKRAIGIRVIKETGRPLSPSESIGRNLMRIVDQMPAFYALGVLVASLNPQGKRIGDYVAGSIVVHERSHEEVRPVWNPASPRTVERRLGGDRLTEDEIAIVEAFLMRRHDLAPDIRYRMAHEILRRMESKLILGDADRAGVEQTLETLVYEHRA